MNMKNTILAAVLLTGAGVFAEDSYLYWQVDQEEESNPIEFTYAQVKATKPDADDIYIGNELLGVEGFEEGGTATWAGPINSAFSASSYGENTGYSFVVELLDSEFGVIGESATFGYADIAPYVWSPMGQTGVSTWTVTAFTVPEPTSGLLFLLGLASLALRRKRVEV